VFGRQTLSVRRTERYCRSAFQADGVGGQQARRAETTFAAAANPRLPPNHRSGPKGRHNKRLPRGHGEFRKARKALQNETNAGGLLYVGANCKIDWGPARNAPKGLNRTAQGKRIAAAATRATPWVHKKTQLQALKGRNNKGDGRTTMSRPYLLRPFRASRSTVPHRPRAASRLGPGLALGCLVAPLWGNISFTTNPRRNKETNEETATGPVYRFFGLPGERNVASRPSCLAVFLTQSALP